VAEKINNNKNQEKYLWEYLNDLLPLLATSTTDMAAEWKLAVVRVHV
jgi:hypothetical protein